jgi:hypothetical protein
VNEGRPPPLSLPPMTERIKGLREEIAMITQRGTEFLQSGSKDLEAKHSVHSARFLSLCF